MIDRDSPVTTDELHAHADGLLPADRRQAVEAWLASHPDDVNSDIRFDVVLVAPKSLPRHIVAAFDASQ